MRIDATEVPVYFARRLYDPKTMGRLDQLLRARNNSGIGIVLSASSAAPACLGPNVVVPLLKALAPPEDEVVVARGVLELAFRTNLSLARGGARPHVRRSETQSATLYIPGKDPLQLIGNEQIVIFERLIKADAAGNPNVQVKTLMMGLGSRGPQQAFRPDMWRSIQNVYIANGDKRGYWRLQVAGPSAGAAV